MYLLPSHLTKYRPELQNCILDRKEALNFCDCTLCVEIYFNPFRFLLKKVSGREKNKGQKYLIINYIVLDFQCFKMGLTTALQIGTVTALIH